MKKFESSCGCCMHCPIPNFYLLFIFAQACCYFFSCTSASHIPAYTFGHTPPGNVATVFARGIVTSNKNEHSGLAIHPHGSLMLWSIMDANYKGQLFEIRFKNGEWSKPAMPSFADSISDYYSPTFSADGSKLYFSSRRQAASVYPTGLGNRIWMVEKMGDDWGTPVPFDSVVSKANEFAHSISKNGTIYFSAVDTPGNDMNIYSAAFLNGKYEAPGRLQGGINTNGYEDGPYIAPNDDYLIFESTRPEGIEGSHDLYISFKNKQGDWDDPINMGASINSGAMERFPRVSPDGRHLFFCSNRFQSDSSVGFDMFWINAAVIDDLRKRSR